MTRRNGEAPHHRNLTCYTNYGCRRPECADRYREWNRNRTNAKKAGQWQPHVDATPVREHLLLLADHGISLRQAAELAGTGYQTLYALFRRPVRHTVRPEHAAAILAINPDETTPRKVDTAGTRRRIQALVADGWPMAHLADHLGVYRSYVHELARRDGKQRTLATTAQKVADGYERLARMRPARHGVNKRLYKQARNLAASRNWPPTTYWATRMDVIDDPHFEPMYGLTRGKLLAADARELFTHGVPAEQAARRLDISLKYLQQVLSRYPEQTELAA